MSPEDEWKHGLYAAILTLGFQDKEFQGFKFYISFR